MNKNAKVVFLWAIAAVVLIVSVLIGRDLVLRWHGALDCGDGPRRTIDIRDFATRYSAYSLELEASVADKGKVSAKLSPVQLQQLSESMQSANEFRKLVVAGYNSCAITKVQYGQYAARFQALDSLAREINELVGKPSLSQEGSTKLAALIGQYGQLAAQINTQ